jgi:hypothetical protein
VEAERRKVAVAFIYMVRMLFMPSRLPQAHRAVIRQPREKASPIDSTFVVVHSFGGSGANEPPAPPAKSLDLRRFSHDYRGRQGRHERVFGFSE